MTNATGKMSHREYVVDRAKRITKMMTKLEGSKELQGAFFDNPQKAAERFDVTLSDEEVYAIKSMRGIELKSLHERLVFSQVAVFDANCGCALADIGSFATNPR